MTYVYQWFGAMMGWAFLNGCMLGLMSPRTYLPRQVPVDATSLKDPLSVSVQPAGAAADTPRPSVPSDSLDPIGPVMTDRSLGRRGAGVARRTRLVPPTPRRQNDFNGKRRH
jgi:hypothetical protein